MGPNLRCVWTLVGSFHSDEPDTPALAAFVVVVAAVAVAAVAAGCQEMDSWESRGTERNRESLQTRCPSFGVVWWVVLCCFCCTTEDEFMNIIATNRWIQ